MENADNRADIQAYKGCTGNKKFCPMSIKQGLIFWSVFPIISITSIIINFMYADPYLLALFAIPAIYLPITRTPLPLFIIGNIIITISVFFVAGLTLMAVIPILAFITISILGRRTVTISQRHYNQKQDYEELFMNTMLSFAKSIDTRDAYTAFHSRHVAQYAKQIAIELGLSNREQEAVYIAGLIHDIGKIGTPESILHKESRLTEEEYEIMKKHPEDGYEIVKDISRLAEVGITDMVRHHHERIDGKGYPLGLKGDQIPLGARILAAADAFDAMTTNRSYRQKLAIDTAVEELQRHSGTQFDSQVASAFIRSLKKTGKIEVEAAQLFGVSAQSAV